MYATLKKEYAHAKYLIATDKTLFDDYFDLTFNLRFEMNFHANIKYYHTALENAVLLYQLDQSQENNTKVIEYYQEATLQTKSEIENITEHTDYQKIIDLESKLERLNVL